MRCYPPAGGLVDPPVGGLSSKWFKAQFRIKILYKKIYALLAQPGRAVAF